MCDNSPQATILIALDVDMSCHANTVDHQYLDIHKTWIELPLRQERLAVVAASWYCSTLTMTVQTPARAKTAAVEAELISRMLCPQM